MKYLNRSILFISILSIFGCAKDDTYITLKVHHFLPPKSTAHAKFIVPWCNQIAQKSSGTMQCQIYPAMQLGGSPAQLFDQVKDGVVDIVWTVPGYSAGRFPSIEAFELPFMMKTPMASSKALWDYVNNNAMEEFSDVHLLATHVHGPGFFHMKSRPILNLEDLNGMKIRAPTRITNQLIAELGATPVGMPVPSVPEALAKGVIDGALVPYEIVPAIKANELTEFHSETPSDSPAIYTTTFIYAMNVNKYKSLSPEHRAIIDNASGLILSGEIGKIFAEGDKTGKSTVSKESINVITTKELEKWYPVAEIVRSQWIEEMNASGKDGNYLLNSAEELTRKYDDE